MNPDPQIKPGYHTWELHARPIGAKHEPWQTVRVAARSAIQAQTILRRRGYESLIESARMIGAKPDPLNKAKLLPLECAQCGYKLVGLTLETASVTCPECSYPQPLVTWRPEFGSQPAESAHIVLWLLAMIGVIALMIFGFLYIAAIMY